MFISTFWFRVKFVLGLSDPWDQQLKPQCDAAFSMEWMLWYSVETITFKEGEMLVAVYK